MEKSELEALGLNAEQVDAVIKINNNDVDKTKSASKTEIENLQTEVTSLQEQVSERDKQLETLKSSAGDNEELQEKIRQLQADNETAKTNHETEMNKLQIDFAVEKELFGANARNVKAVKALLDLTDAKLDKEGKVKGLAEQIEKLTAGEDTKFLFNVEEQQGRQQTFKGFQPGSSTIVPDSKKAGYETRLSDARKNNNQLEVIKIKQEAFENDGLVLM